MQTTIDSAGRIIVPKALRDAMGVKAGQALQLEVHDGRLEIAVAPTAMRLRGRGRRVVAVPEVELPPLTAGQVRATLEQTRR
jgi:AbrB family looped-hinge helix DNA binding protein